MVEVETFYFSILLIVMCVPFLSCLVARICITYLPAYLPRSKEKRGMAEGDEHGEGEGEGEGEKRKGKPSEYLGGFPMY